jgi:hypothetical protein
MAMITTTSNKFIRALDASIGFKVEKFGLGCSYIISKQFKI